MGAKTGWRLRPEIEIPSDLARLKQDRRILHLLARAGIQTYEEALAFLDPTFYHPTSAYELPDMEWALTRILRAIDSHEPILVWGDFDVDGITATSLLIEVLRAVGGNVQYTIPLRLEEGHGVHIPRAITWAERGIRLVITVDTGISAHPAIDALNQAGVDVIVTDHHQLPETLPNALANVNPQRLPPDHSLHLLSGAGVAYKLVEAIAGRLNRLDLLPAALELACIGLIADVVPLLRENRYLVQMGLAGLKRTGRQGIKALCHVAKLVPDVLDEEDVAFQLAPRLNALGRLADAAEGVELLTTQDPARAAMLANQVDALNVKRRSLTQQVVKGAEALIISRPDIADSSVLVVAHESWPAGVLGLAASQLAEKYEKPALVIRAPKGEMARGSARSIEGININALLNSHSHLLTQWGGHDMAAGFALETGLIDDLRLALSRAVRVQGRPTQSDLLDIDILLPIGDGQVGEALLRRLAPFGAGFPKPLFMTQGVSILKESTIGRDAQHLKLTVQETEGQPQTLLMWNSEITGWVGRTVDIAYRLRVRDGQSEIIAEHVFEREDPPDPTAASITFLILDWRGMTDERIDQNIIELEHSGLSVEQWQEGQVKADRIRRFTELQIADVLVIWHCPPHRNAFKQAMERVKPRQLAFVGLPCAFDEINAFAQALLGAVRYAVTHQNGRLRVIRLAERLGHTYDAIAQGLRWLEAMGRIAIISTDADFVVAVEDKPAQPEAAKLQSVVKTFLAEAEAFRRFAQTSSLTTLVG